MVNKPEQSSDVNELAHEIVEEATNNKRSTDSEKPEDESDSDQLSAVTATYIASQAMRDLTGERIQCDEIGRSVTEGEERAG